MIAVLMYYLLTVKEFSVVLVKLSTDKSTETLFMTEAQSHLHENQEGQEMKVQECYLFGSSTQNMKIESWWALLIIAKVEHIKEMFEDYDMEEEFTGSK